MTNVIPLHYSLLIRD